MASVAAAIPSESGRLKGAEIAVETGGTVDLPTRIEQCRVELGNERCFYPDVDLDCVCVCAGIDSDRAWV
jgi:hypothetical protein